MSIGGGVYSGLDVEPVSDPGDFEASEQWTPDVVVENTGIGDALAELRVTVDGNTATSNISDIPAGGSVTWTPTVPSQSEGEYEILFEAQPKYGSGDTEMVTVAWAGDGSGSDPEPSPAEFEIEPLPVPEVDVVEAWGVTVDVENVGGSEDTVAVDASLDTGWTATQRLTLAPGDVGSANFTVEPDSPGVKTFTVTAGDDSRSATLRFEEDTESQPNVNLEQVFVRVGDPPFSPGQQIELAAELAEYNDVRPHSVDVLLGVDEGEQGRNEVSLQTVTWESGGGYTRTVFARADYTIPDPPPEGQFTIWAKTNAVDSGPTLLEKDIEIERPTTDAQVQLEEILLSSGTERVSPGEQFTATVGYGLTEKAPDQDINAEIAVFPDGESQQATIDPSRDLGESTSGEQDATLTAPDREGRDSFAVSVELSGPDADPANNTLSVVIPFEEEEDNSGPSPPLFSLSGPDTDREPTVGDSVTVTITVYNDGGQEGEGTVVLDETTGSGISEIGSESFSLGAGEQTTVEMRSFSADSAGVRDYKAQVNNDTTTEVDERQTFSYDWQPAGGGGEEPAPADVEVADLVVPSGDTPGALPSTVSVTLSNPTSSDLQPSLVVTADGQTALEESPTVPSGGTTTRETVIQPPSPGSTSSAVVVLVEGEERASDTAEWVPDDTGPEPQPQFGLLPLPGPGILSDGETWTLEAEVENTGDAPGVATVSAAQQSQDLSIDPGQTQVASFDVTMPGSRERDVTVTVAANGQTVDERSTTVEWEEGTSEPEEWQQGDVQIGAEDTSSQPGNVTVPFSLNNTVAVSGTVNVFAENNSAEEIGRTEGIELAENGSKSDEVALPDVEEATGVLLVATDAASGTELDTVFVTVTVEDSAPAGEPNLENTETVAPSGTLSPGEEAADAIGIRAVNTADGGRATGVDVHLLHNGERIAPIGIGHTVEPGESVEITRDIVAPSETATYGIEAESNETDVFYTDEVTVEVESEGGEEGGTGGGQAPQPGDPIVRGQPSSPQQTLEAFGGGFDVSPQVSVTPNISPSIQAPSLDVSNLTGGAGSDPQPQPQPEPEPEPEPEPPADSKYDGPLTYLDPLGIFGTTRQLPTPAELFGND